MNEETLIEHLIEIKENQATANAQLQSLHNMLETHTKADKETEDRVLVLEKEASKLKGALAFITFSGVLMGLLVGINKLF